MRIALISDIHGNLVALDAVLADIAARQVGATYHLGDLVGYGPWPNEVVARIGQARIAGVAGNYDSTVATNHAHCGCRVEGVQQEALAHRSFEWTCQAVTAETRTALLALPYRLDIRPRGSHATGPTVVLQHATAVSSLVYVTADRSDDFLRTMVAQVGARAGDVVCCGHTHVPWVRAVDGVTVINTGSVGRPKDRDARASYILLDVGGDAVHAEVVRVAYDVEAVARGLGAAGLPREFAEFLRTGGAS